jgi:hypothetical protein
VLTADQLAQWNANGFLVLPGFYSPDALAPLLRFVESVWVDPPSYLVVDGTHGGGRRRLIDVPAADRGHRLFKLNDLYLERPEVRELAAGPRLVPLLNRLMGEPVVLCNSLNFEKGSGQPEHIDSLYMTPRTPGKLLATWVALEDAHPDAGQLFYYPGSHTIPRYTFSDGTHHAVDGEYPAWREYILRQIAERGLKREQFPARAGDVFVWSADLVHGGTPIADRGRTRKSLVCHYAGHADAVAQGYDRVPVGEGFWLRRPHAPLDGDPLRKNTLRRRVGRLLRAVGLHGVVKKLAG